MQSKIALDCTAILALPLIRRKLVYRWLPDIIDKLARKHHLDQDDAEEVFFNQPRYWFVERGHRPGEEAYAATGQTDAGRSVIVVFIRKENTMALILRETTEKVRLLVHGQAKPTKSIALDVFEFV